MILERLPVALDEAETMCKTAAQRPKDDRCKLPQPASGHELPE